MLVFILILFLAFWLFGSHYGYNRWGYGGGIGVGGVLLLILVIWLLSGGPSSFGPGPYWRW